MPTLAMSLDAITEYFDSLPRGVFNTEDPEDEDDEEDTDIEFVPAVEEPSMYQVRE